MSFEVVVVCLWRLCRMAVVTIPSAAWYLVGLLCVWSVYHALREKLGPVVDEAYWSIVTWLFFFLGGAIIAIEVWSLARDLD
jgi:hypothetical protein